MSHKTWYSIFNHSKFGATVSYKERFEAMTLLSLLAWQGIALPTELMSHIFCFTEQSARYRLSTCAN
jgi:hypothetical protein